MLGFALLAMTFGDGRSPPPKVILRYNHIRIPDVAVGVVSQLRQVIQTGQPIIEGEVEAETPAHPGESRHYMHNYYPDKSKDGTVVGVRCIVQDITEHIERETRSRPRL